MDEDAEARDPVSRFWSLDPHEREAVLVLRRSMRRHNQRCTFWSRIDAEVDEIRERIDRQRERHLAWRRSRAAWWQFWKRNEDEPLNPDAYPQPLVADDDGWMLFMVAIERLKAKGVLYEKPLHAAEGLDYMYWFLP